MKRVLLIFALFGAFSLAANAQHCAGKKAAAKAESCTKVDQATLDEAAAADESIVKQVSNNGEVKYVRKEVCEKSGKVSYTEVEYCSKAKKFINVSPSEDGAASCTKDAKATKMASKDGKKACCSGKEKKACCAGGKKAKASKTSSESKMTNQEEGTN